VNTEDGAVKAALAGETQNAIDRADGTGTGVKGTAPTASGGAVPTASGVTAPATVGSAPARAVTVPGEAAGGGAAGDVAGLVGLLTERVLALSVQAPRAPSSVRISAGAVLVEICWPAEPGGYPGQAGATGQYGAVRPVATGPGASGPAVSGLAASGPAGGGSELGEGGRAAPVSMTNGDGGHGKTGHPDGPADTFPLCAGTVGTFYRAPEPGAAPFVAEGDTVRPGQQVAIIEAMKLMIPVEAERAGEVVEFLVADRAPVEYGQPLMLLREASR
jgi:acetyl-CoA carboxylase biotin carboxyl carrier protein